ncbi:hypothetical protein MRB53_033060 [Persea americana]|uniref:Uncharacterized protein n=1 Tax=Persea americana TaxID=3435 RepID=A0ACC2KU47_PERAE|nr:hypothetical protein MRB53_033060 [Persea americana]
MPHTAADCVRAIYRDRDLLRTLCVHLQSLDPDELADAVATAAQQVTDYVDHACWERPEDMDTPRSVFKIEKNNPRSDVAAETAAALATASLVFRRSDPSYSKLLLKTAIRLKEDSEKRKLVKTEVVSETRKSSSLGEKELSPKLKNKAQNAEAKQAIKAMATPKVPNNDSNAKLHCAISFCSDNSRGLKQGKTQNIIERKKSFMSERPVSPMAGTTTSLAMGA